MGTLNFTVGDYGTNKGRGAATVRSTAVKASDAFTTSTSAANVQDGAGAITLAVGQVFMCVASEPMWIAFGGTTATVGNDHYLLADIPYEFECNTAGAVSVIDVS